MHGGAAIRIETRQMSTPERFDRKQWSVGDAIVLLNGMDALADCLSLPQ